MSRIRVVSTLLLGMSSAVFENGTVLASAQSATLTLGASQESAMSLAENKRCVGEWLKTLDSGDEARVSALIDEIVTDDYVLHTGGSTLSDPQDVVGREGLRNHVRIAYRTFADMRHLVQDEFGDNDRLVTRAQFSAKQIGEFCGVPPTGARIECSVIYVQHFRACKIRECWIDWDSLLAVVGQLGALSRTRSGVD
jgi:predicted ester cyclase